MNAIEFLNNETAKNIKLFKKGKPVTANMFPEGQSTSHLDLFCSKTDKKISANHQARTKNKNLKAESENYVVHLVARELTNNPTLVLNLKHGIVASLPKIQKSIKANQNIDINLYKAYVNSTRAKKQLPLLLALAARGIISFSDSDKLLIRAGAGMVSNQNKILFLTARQQVSAQYRKTGKYCGIFKEKMAITRFSSSVINSLTASHKGNCGSSLLKWLVSNYNVKLEKPIQARDNIIYDQFNFDTLSAQEIADGILSGTFSKEDVSVSCSKEKIKEINNCIKNNLI